MIEYPSIINSSKAPRKHGIAFEKLDGSNFRAKWTQKNGFCLFGTRTQLVDENTAFWQEAVSLFKSTIADPLSKKFASDSEFRNHREIIVFSEFLGDKSFAGRHIDDDPKRLVVFDVLVGHKNGKFVKPLDFIKEFQEIVPIPNVVYVGKLNDQFIEDVRAGTYPVNEGVIFKGTETSGAYVGGVWSCKIKTMEYYERLRTRHGDDWKKYWE